MFHSFLYCQYTGERYIGKMRLSLLVSEKIDACVDVQHSETVDYGEGGFAVGVCVCNQ